jgi:hypothetical protein
MNDLITIERPGPPAIVAELAPFVTAAKQYEVKDVASHEQALTIIKRFRNGERGIEEHFARAKKAASDAHKELVRSIAALVGPIAEARSIMDHKADEYEKEEQRKADEEARRLQEKARKEEEDRKLAEAQAAQDAGDKALAEEIMSEPVTVPVVIVAPAVAEVAGVSTRILWSAEVFDLMALVRFVAANPQWEHLLEPNVPNLNRLAVAQHEAMKTPGVRAVSTTSRSTRR